MKALEKQLEHELKNNDEKIETIFIGGGTPSTIKAELYEPIFKLLSPYISYTKEITIEANPNSASYDWLSGIFDLGINRVSFGVQSFDDEKLKFLNRSHNRNSAISVIQNANCIGFNHVNCDIIYGTALDSYVLIDEDLKMIKQLPIDHVSAYDLTLEEGTYFFNKPEVKKENLNLAQYIFDKLENDLGFSQYEISNFSKNNESRSSHNVGYWLYKPYLGVGAGAVGRVKNHRYYPYKEIEKYIHNPLEYEIENLTLEDQRIEKILLGLRCFVGVEKKIFSNEESSRIKILLEEKKLIEDAHKIYNTNFLLADELAWYITQ